LKNLQATRKQRQKERKQKLKQLKNKDRKKTNEEKTLGCHESSTCGFRQTTEKKEFEKGGKGHGNEKKGNKLHLLGKAHQILLNVP
jgi:hypothetical protein